MIKLTLNEMHIDAIETALINFKNIMSGKFTDAFKNIFQHASNNNIDKAALLISKIGFEYTEENFEYFDKILENIKSNNPIEEKDLYTIQSWTECFSRLSLSQIGNALEEVFSEQMHKKKIYPMSNAFRGPCSFSQTLLNGLSDGCYYSIMSNVVDDKARQTFDIVQCIRHYFWKKNPSQQLYSVASSIMLSSTKNQNQIIITSLKETE